MNFHLYLHKFLAFINSHYTHFLNCTAQIMHVSVSELLKDDPRLKTYGLGIMILSIIIFMDFENIFLST